MYVLFIPLVFMNRFLFWVFFFVICAIYTVMCNTQNTYQRFNRLHELSEQAPQSEMITTVLMFVLIVKY